MMSDFLEDNVGGYYRNWDMMVADENHESELKSFIGANCLSKDEYVIIGAYTCRYSRRINAIIRSGEEISDDEQKNIVALNSALDKIPSLNDALVFRYEDHDECIDDFIKENKKGDFLQLNYFASTFQDEYRRPEAGNFNIDIRTKTEHSNCKDISLIGKSSEKEALFKSGTRFCIEKIDRINKKIILNEI